jgi:methionyl aminopeptidase
MALIKTESEIQAMREGGAILSRALQAAVDAVKPGITMRELDLIATQVMESAGARPSFKGYKARGSVPFPATVCISRNEEVVHGLGNRSEKLRAGDIVSLDIGCWYKDLCTDMAVTVPVGKINQIHQRLIEVTRASMYAGVAAAVAGDRIWDISAAIEGVVNQDEYGIVKSLVGHGVGHAVHEDPNVPNYVGRYTPKLTLQTGMCLAIEPMLTLGTDEIVTKSDGWTIVTEDGSWSAHFEVTLAILESGPEILTPQPKLGF